MAQMSWYGREPTVEQDWARLVVDEIVPLGVTINPPGDGWVSPALAAAARHR